MYRSAAHVIDNQPLHGNHTPLGMLLCVSTISCVYVACAVDPGACGFCSAVLIAVAAAHPMHAL